MSTTYKRSDLKRLKRDELCDIAKETELESELRNKSKTELIDIICQNTVCVIPKNKIFDFEDCTLIFDDFRESHISLLPNISFSYIYSHITGLFFIHIIISIVCAM